MGSAPTFNIEVKNAPESIFEKVLDELSDKYSINSIYKSYSEMIFDDFEFQIRYMKSYSEYMGNEGQGIVIRYQPYYSESMDKLLPKFEIMTELRDELSEMDILSEYDINYYSTGCTI